MSGLLDPGSWFSDLGNDLSGITTPIMNAGTNLWNSTGGKMASDVLQPTVGSSWFGPALWAVGGAMTGAGLAGYLGAGSGVAGGTAAGEGAAGGSSLAEMSPEAASYEGAGGATTGGLGGASSYDAGGNSQLMDGADPADQAQWGNKPGMSTKQYMKMGQMLMNMSGGQGQPPSPSQGGGGGGGGGQGLGSYSPRTVNSPLGAMPGNFRFTRDIAASNPNIPVGQDAYPAVTAARGGMMPQVGGQGLGGFHDGGDASGARFLTGPGDGVSDDIPASIDGVQPAKLASNEFVVPARIVSELGNGSSEAGARKLYAMVDRIEKARKNVSMAGNSRADKALPA